MMNWIKDHLLAFTGIMCAAVLGLAISMIPAAAQPSRPDIIKYQFTYHRDGLLVAVTTQDKFHHINSYPCSTPARSVNGNYSISCDLP